MMLRFKDLYIFVVSPVFKARDILSGIFPDERNSVNEIILALEYSC